MDLTNQPQDPRDSALRRYRDYLLILARGQLDPRRYAKPDSLAKDNIPLCCVSSFAGVSGFHGQNDDQGP